MKEIVLQAEKRSPVTDGALQAMRRQGRVPGVAYGEKGEPISLSVDEKTLQKVLRSEGGRNALMTLQVGERSYPVLIKEIQRDIITRAILHVDFHRVSLKQKVEASVPLHVKGEAPGVKLSGGVLEHLVRAVRVRCFPAEIPTSLDVDVSSLQIGQAAKAKDLTVPPAVELLLDPESVIVNVVSPTILEEPAAGAAPAATAAEPEVIKKGKVEEAAEGTVAEAGAEKKAAPGAAGAKAEAKKPEGK